MSLPSKIQLGRIAYFQPFIAKAGEGQLDDTAVPCRVVGIQFLPGKILYDLALPDGEGSFYETFPLRGVDSYFVMDRKESL